MASRRILKKRVKRVVIEILDLCDYIVVSNGPNAKKADKLMDDAVDFHDMVMSKINSATDKKAFNEILKEIDEKSKFFEDEVNAL